MSQESHQSIQLASNLLIWILFKPPRGQWVNKISRAKVINNNNVGRRVTVGRSGAHITEGFFHHHSNSMENLFCSHPNYSEVIAIKFCTWHNSFTAKACAKFCSNMIPSKGSSYTKTNFPWNLNYNRKKFVKWDPGLAKHIEAWKKWPPYCRRHFHIDFLRSEKKGPQKIFVFWSKFHWISFFSYRSNRRYVNTYSGNGSMSRKHQAITWTNANYALWCHLASLGHKEFTIVTWAACIVGQYYGCWWPGSLCHQYSLLLTWFNFNSNMDK